MRRYLNYAIVGAGVVLVLGTLLAPKMLSWWFTSPVPVPISCTPAVEWTAHRLIDTQLWSILIGLVAGLGVALGTRKKAEAAAPGTLPQGAPAAQASTSTEAAKK